MIEIMPAIDLRGGKCVRLRQGVAEDATEYSDDPVAMARRWEREGGGFLHVVDLDGAFDGAPRHTGILRRIAAAVGMPIEIGGGLRTDEDIETVLSAGASRAILGTRACERPGELKRLVSRFGGARIVAGIDARDGMVQTRGWVETTDVRAVELARRVAAAGIETIIYTDTARDGMMKGVNAGQMDAVCDAVDCNVVASGGVSSVDDIARLASLGRGNLVGAIVGKALYDGSVTLPELKAAATAAE